MAGRQALRVWSAITPTALHRHLNFSIETDRLHWCESLYKATYRASSARCVAIFFGFADGPRMLPIRLLWLIRVGFAITAARPLCPR